jgi:hypothetical protein
MPQMPARGAFIEYYLCADDMSGIDSTLSGVDGFFRMLSQGGGAVGKVSQEPQRLLNNHEGSA